MIYAKKLRLELVDGPSKAELVDALKYAYSKQRRQAFAVTFKFKQATHSLSEDDCCRDAVQATIDRLNNLHSKKLSALVTGLVHEDGSGEKFLVRGMLEFCQYKCIKASFNDPYTGFFDTGNRAGWLDVEIRFADDK